MLCKTTMRAALAHVLGIVGIVGAFGAGAAADHPYASESITGDKAPYAIKGSPMGKIVMDVTLDTLLEAETYYLVVNFWTAQLTAELGLSYQDPPVTADTAGARGDPNADPPVATTQPMVGRGTGFRFYTVTESVRPSATGVTPVVAGVDGSINAVTDVTFPLTRAYRGDATDTSGVYRMVVTGGGLAIDTHIRLDLSNNLAVPSKGAASYRGDLYIYEELGDARAAARASAPGDVPDNHLFSAHNPLFEVKSKIAKPTVMAHLATADVGYERSATLDDDDNVLVSNGGPFRGFEPRSGIAGSANNGLLATITLNEVVDNPATRMVNESEFLDADRDRGGLCRDRQYRCEFQGDGTRWCLRVRRRCWHQSSRSQGRGKDRGRQPGHPGGRGRLYDPPRRCTDGL